MENKEIYIDGVDVSGCEYYCERYCKQVVAEDGCYVFLCAEDENCHYKKWQRKEQECEELKEILNEGCLHDLTLMTEQRVLLQTLTEIKEIAERCGKRIPLFEIDEMAEDLKQILQKISEVLE